MIWRESHRADKESLPLADRHYNRQKPGTPQFVPPGRCLVFRSFDSRALWITSWPFSEYVKLAGVGVVWSLGPIPTGAQYVLLAAYALVCLWNAKEYAAVRSEK